MRTDKRFSDFSVGDYVAFARTFQSSDFENFSAISGDRNPLHHDLTYAQKTSFAATILPVYMLASPLSAIAGMMLPGHRSLILNTSFKALKPAHYGKEIRYSAKITSTSEIKQVLSIDVIAYRGKDVLLEGQLVVQVRDDIEAGAWTEESPYPVLHSAENRRILITGAGGAIGRALARLLSGAGFHLVLQCRNASKEIVELKSACERNGVEVDVVPGDLATADGRRNCLEYLQSKKDIFCLVHAACPPIESSYESLAAVNFEALRDLSGSLLENMLKAQRGKIVFIGSSALQFQPDGWENYIAAKGAAQTVINSLSKKYSAYGIDAATLAPGIVQSAFSEKFRKSDNVGLLPAEVADAVLKMIQGKESGSYVWMEAGSIRGGSYSFNDSSPGSQPVSAITSFRGGTSAENGISNPADVSGIDQLMINFFKLPGGYDLSAGGLSITPGWDSLRHIELLLHLESKLGIHFTSGELDKTTRVASLKELIRAKRS